MRLIALLAVLLSLPCPAAGQLPDTGDSVPIVLLRRSSRGTPDGSSGDVLVAADVRRDEIARRAAQVMADRAGYSQFVLRLDRFARTVLLRNPGLSPERRASLERPSYLFLSDRQGGFPVEGFWLEEPGGTVRQMPETPFVDLVVEEGDFDPSDNDGLVAIHAHELGHLIMGALAGPAPRRASTGVHFTTVRTDGWLAFVEGWGEHFQPMAVDHHRKKASGEDHRRDACATDHRRNAGATDHRRDACATDHRRNAHGDETSAPPERVWYDRFAREQIEGCGICPANLRFLRWQGPGEQRLREEGVRSNLFIHDLVLPPALAAGSRPPFEARMYRDVMPPSSDGPLKSGARALASEGLVATFFHRLASDERLRRSYREPAFYAPFLPDTQAGPLVSLGPSALISPEENAYLKIFHVLHHAFSWGDWPLVELVKGYAATFPDEAAIVYDVFLDVTRGVTVERAAFSRHADPGYLPWLRERLLSGEVRLDGNLGRPLWLVVPRVSLGMGVYRYFLVPSPFTFDLNAADAADLRSVPGVDAALAASIVKARDERGAFDRVEDLASVPGMTPELVSRFVSMRERMQARLDEREWQGSNPTWVMNWLVRLLKGSYHLAAAWQLGRALVLAALLYLLTSVTIGAAFSRGVNRSGAAARGGRLGSLRRLVRSLARGLAVAVWPLAGSVALYAAGILPGPANMTAVGAAVGLAIVGLRRATGSAAPGRFAALAPVAGSIAAAILIGSMY